MVVSVLTLSQKINTCNKGTKIGERKIIYHGKQLGLRHMVVSILTLEQKINRKGTKIGKERSFIQMVEKFLVNIKYIMIFEV